MCISDMHKYNTFILIGTEVGIAEGTHLTSEGGCYGTIRSFTQNIS